MTTTSDPAALPVTLAVQVAGRELHIIVCGELDLACTTLFDGLFDVEAGDVDRVVLHLGGLTFCDVAGINALDGLCEHHQRQGRTVETVDEVAQVRRLRALLGSVPLPSRRGTSLA